MGVGGNQCGESTDWDGSKETETAVKPARVPQLYLALLSGFADACCLASAIIFST